MQNLSGQTIDHYTIHEAFFDGGMAVVYKTFNTQLERDVAIKINRKEQVSLYYSQTAPKTRFWKK
jgi:hypothetical protein